jgi:hypothetical protein
MESLATPVRRKKKSQYRPVKLSRSDVFGVPKMREGQMVGREGGMVVAKSGEMCPVFKDEIPPMALTLVGRTENFDDLEYWLEYVKGVNCITRRYESEDGYIALRAEHQSVQAKLQSLTSRDPLTKYREHLNAR